ncbi:MAG: hypothetical protein II975_07370 [Bacteroidales bacterium]|nr:hypothetical protein [Bacteroidales bacterium]
MVYNWQKIMGFLNNMMEEAGKKTGKAIGNKLFGQYADDYRIRVADGGSTESDSKSLKAVAKIEAKTKKEEREAELEMHEKEKEAEFMKELRELSFNASDIDYNINVLSQLVSLMESANSEDDKTKESIIALATSKFDTGLAICRAINPNNPMVAYFTQKKQEIFASKEKKKAEKKKSERRIWIIILAASLGSLLLMLAL